MLGGGTQYAMVVDLTWGGWMELAEMAEAAGFPYLRLDAANHQFVQAADDYLRDRGAIDAALVFSDEPQLDQSLYFLIGNSYIRVVVIDSTVNENCNAQLAHTASLEIQKTVAFSPSPL